MAIMCNGLHISSDSPGVTVDKSASHQLSQTEIASDNPCSRHLSINRDFLREKTTVRFPLNKHRVDIEETITMMSNIAALLHTHHHQSDVVPLCLPGRER
jgi:hypothetical protein